ncbi:MAG: ATP-binding protein [Gammaproteobacteria bacterium]
MSRLGIKYQILVIVLIPVFLVDAFLTYTNISNSIAQANELLQSKGHIIAKQIAGASEFNVFAGNHRQIQYLLDQSIDTHAIVMASVYDSQGGVIAKSVSGQYQEADTASYYYYRQAIMSESIELTDVFTPDQNDTRRSQIIGWVHIHISREQLELTKSRIINSSIIFFIIALVLALILTTIISRGITRPIFTLVDHLKHVETGHLGEAIEPVEKNEIGAVQEGFNRMTQSLFTNRRHLNERIQQVTQKMSEAITDMESKNRELGFAKDEAQNANRIKSEFLANMSHEIRTPINGIKGFINLMRKSDLTPTQKKYTDIVLRSTNDLTNIINEILDFSKMESGKLQIVDDDFDLYEVIEQTRDILFINILTKDIDLILIIYSDTPRYVCADKLRLKQILLNLIGNAIKFTDRGSVVIRVSAEQQDQDETWFEIAIEDTGIGISDQNQQRLFKAFSQVETAPNRRFSGTGLGLVISKNLVTLMGGEISIESEFGKGSTFTVRLPLALSNSFESTAPEPENFAQSALIFAFRKPCLQEIQTLFERAGVATEPILLDDSYSADQIRDRIWQNRNYINFVVFDLRHINFDLTEIFDDALLDSVRLLTMHYDQTMIPSSLGREFEFVSIIDASSNLPGILDPSSVEPALEQLDGMFPAGEEQQKDILLVDDNDINLKLGSELIRLWGHRVTEATHADEAMALYCSRTFDLIILDIQMPDIDGITLLKMMREEKPDDSTPVVALTANILPQESERLLDLGFDYYLGKPIDEVKFHRLLQGSVERKIITPEDGSSDQLGLQMESVDLEKSLALAGDNDSLLQQIFGILLCEIPDHQRQLSGAVQALDYDKISAIVHKIHGITCYTSLPRLKQQVLKLQQQLSSTPHAALAEEAIQAIIVELGQVALETERFLEQVGETVD